MRLYRRGTRPENFPVGTQVTIDGYLARNGTPTATSGKLTFADGRTMTIGAGAVAGDVAQSRRQATVNGANVIVVPSPSTLSARISPPCATTRLRAIVEPSPGAARPASLVKAIEDF